ncbi:hypothetical protein GGS21DRAFT_187649 [Xylaria nigripes]|nr:hypothetical protein GGS21DRAFT_187649 [Xylaria nigripes]
MAISTDEALKVLDQSYRDILIQAGKHFRLMAKDGPGVLVGTDSGIRAKAADSLSQYHHALGVIEAEIIRAKSVLIRDLESLRTARAPAPVTITPVPPIPTPQPAAPPAPMMELPSAAAHSHNLNTSTPITVPIPAPATTVYPQSKEVKTVAPFPDMGLGMSSDVVDLTAGEKKPSPRVPAGSVKPVARPTPPVNVTKPHSKAVPKPMPPTKVTPIPPPQIPRLQAFQSSNTSTQPKPHSSPQLHKAAQATPPTRQVVPAKMVQDKAVGGKLDPPPTGTNNIASTGTGNGNPNFTNMEFSLASVPGTGKPKGAPPAPMPKFDLATVAPQGGNLNNAKGNVARKKTTQPVRAGSNMDDFFNLGDPNKGGDSIFDLGGGEANDSTFDDMMYFGGNSNNQNHNNNNSDMAQFDDAYFGL